MSTAPITNTTDTLIAAAAANTQAASVAATTTAPAPAATLATTDLNQLPVYEYKTNARVERMYNSLIRSVEIPRYYFKVISNKEGEPQIKTADGYTVTLKGKEQDWTITGPDDKTTRIWGDPHVVNSDGKTWDFYKDSTFVFGNNKITVETVPAGNGATLTGRITLYSGRERFTISDIDKNKPSFVEWSLDGESHDKKLNDGDIYRLGKTGSGDHRWDISK